MMFVSILGLGGHSFIEVLGNDPLASFEQQAEIVAACLNSGIQWLDTTYYQERARLGEILRMLGRRDEAKIIAWNFFKEPGREHELVGFTPYRSEHLDLMLEELGTSFIDLLVVHAHHDSDRLDEEMLLASKWLAEGRIRGIGLGMATVDHLERLELSSYACSTVLAPYNCYNQNSKALFEKAKLMGLHTIAMSPFLRGWRLNEIAGNPTETAQLLLRWVLSNPCVDRIMVSMRKSEWIAANLEAVNMGVLSEAEISKMNEWVR